MKVLIIDDDETFANRLKEDLFKFFIMYCDRTIFDIKTTNFTEVLTPNNYDFVFMDIDLEGASGIWLANQMKQKSIFKNLIFISSHSNLVFDSLKIHPYFFLRKGEYQRDIKVLFELLEDSFRNQDFITLKYRGMTQTVSIQDIIYVETINHTLVIHSLEEDYKDTRLLKDFLNEVPDENFVQIHKSYAINLDYLEGYTSNDVSLVREVKLNIGRVYKDNFNTQYRRYLLK